MKTAILSVVAAVACLSATCATAPDASENIEALPQPQAYRSSAYRPVRLQPKSYDRKEDLDEYSYLLTRDSRQSLGEYASPSEELEEHLRRVLRKRQGSLTKQRIAGDDDEYEAAASTYGGYGSESGHGLTCTSGYVNASAVALLAFLFLLNIVQDVITQITGRRKRDVGEEEDDSSILMQFIGDGGIDALYQNLPGIMLPLMVKLSDAESPSCIQRPLCEANLHLSESYGAAGRVIGSLVSNIAAKTYSGAQASNFDAALSAASEGRAGSCQHVKICPRGGVRVSWKTSERDNEASGIEPQLTNSIK